MPVLGLLAGLVVVLLGLGAISNCIWKDSTAGLLSYNRHAKNIRRPRRPS